MKEQFGRDTFPVGRYHCTMTLADGAIGTEWEPRFPKRLHAKELAQYRAGRDAFLAHVVGEGKVLVIEA
jgi:hypothetical protein